MKKIKPIFSAILQWIWKHNEVLIAHLIFMFLFLWAGKLWLERSSLTDNSAYLFQLINSDGFSIPHNRYGAIIIQLLPKTFIWSGLPLKWVMISWSLSPVIYFYLISMFLFFIRKDKSSAWILILIYIVSGYHYFFWTCSEIQIGLPVVILYRSFLHRNLNMLNTKFMFINFLYAVILNLFHPILLFPFVFIAGMEWLNKKQWQNFNRTIAFIPAILVFLLHYKIFPPDSYEAAKMLTVSKVILGFQHFFSLPSTQQFFQEYTMIFLRLYLLLVVSFIFLLSAKKYFQLIWMLICLVVLVFVVNASYPNGESFFSMTSDYMPLSLIAVIVFCDVKHINFKKWFYPVLILVVLVHFNYQLYSQRWLYVKRQRNIQTLVDELRVKNATKFIIDDDSFVTKNFYWTWAMATETMMLSSLESPDKSITAYCKSPQSPVPDKLNNRSFILMPYAPLFSTEKFNRKYFSLKDEEYKILPKGSLDNLELSK